MEFREYAASEVSALIERLVSDADRRATTRVEHLQHEHEAALTALRGELAAQGQELEQRAQAREKLAAELDAARVHADTLRAELETRSTELESRSAELADQAAELAKQTARLEAQGAALEAQGTALEAQRAETEAQRALAESHASAEHQLAQAQASTAADLVNLRAALEAAQAEADAQRTLATAHLGAEDELGQMRSALETAQAEVDRLTRQFDSALEELRQEHMSTLQQQALERTVLPLDELLSVFAELSKASTPSAVLKAVVTGLAHEFSRVALFRLRGSRLECVTHEGFDFEGDISKVVIPTTVDSLLTRAVTSKKTHSFLAGVTDGPCGAPFGGTPACALAMPLVSGDATVAVIYADDSDQLEFGSVPAPLLVKFAEIVWQHAILVLHRASAAKKALSVTPSQSFDRPA
jgi:hypothetical protein